ncbi:MAG: endolytic transglycosylase MltG [Bacteriovoracaceae bacterium]|nr:endolytic transglycosylase MltG [Bacteriovoracaceae bacterium]
MKKYWWIFIFAAPAMAFSMAALMVYYMMAIWQYSGEPIVFEVKPGEGFSRINGRLHKEGLISNAKIFHRYAQINGLMTKFKAGRFEIKPQSSMLDIFDTLIYGQSLTETVTIPEGKNLFEIAEILKGEDIIEDVSEFIRLSKSPEIAKELGIPAERVEGYLYPDTYRFTPKSEAKDVIKNMVEIFNKKTSSLDFSQAPLNLSKHEVVILASVVEKETGASFERPMIAGVFLNRLKKRMRLQSDPTTIYGIYENFNGNLRKADLLQKTPYNTYKIPALPKGPISNPGIKSIQAILSPENHSFLYFVSQNDGTHVFSKTYKDHKEAVERFQKNWRARKGKSWRDLKNKENK